MRLHRHSVNYTCLSRPRSTIFYALRFFVCPFSVCVCVCSCDVWAWKRIRIDVKNWLPFNNAQNRNRSSSFVCCCGCCCFLFLRRRLMHGKVQVRPTIFVIASAMLCAAAIAPSHSHNSLYIYVHNTYVFLYPPPEKSNKLSR